MAAPSRSAHLSNVWPDATTLTRDGQLALSGVALGDLARRFGTPLYVYHVDTVRRSLAEYRAAFAPYAPVRVGYSVKACGLIGVLALINGADASVASLGEIDAAAAAGMNIRRAWLHGNAKTENELRGALERGVGRVVIDGTTEVARLEALAQRPQQVWLRLAPGIDAATHSYLRTGARDQKFGIPVANGDALALAADLVASRRLRLVGLHVHIGSQIKDLVAFERVAAALVDFARELRERLRIRVHELCVGGGLAVAQTSGDHAPDLAAYARAVAGPIRAARDLDGPTIVLEPGRGIVARAGIALYRVVERKPMPDGLTFVSVDGGMGDNIRPALYGARYEASLVARPDAAAEEQVVVAGAYCEAGDVLIESAELPRARVGEVLAIPSVGAYSVAMSSNYNNRPRPAVVLVDRGGASLIRRRERTADLLRLERVAVARGGRVRRGDRGSRRG